MTEATDRIEEARPRRFRPYPEYKDSGVEWLGRIPAHWESKALKRPFRVVNGSTPTSGESDNWDGDIPWVTPDDLGKMSHRVLNEPARYLTPKGYESCGTQMVRARSLVLSTRAPIGHLAIAGTSVCTNQGCRSLVFRHSGNETYFYFQLHAAKPVLEAAGRGSTFKELASEDLQSVDLSVPPLDEQRAIADFLDRETAKIDALVARKERLIELLQEKRTGLITRAVTRGLDPNVPMKDSGVEWLGEIPVHWDVKRLKHLVPGVTVGIVVTPSKYYVDDGIPCLRSLNVSRGTIDMDNLVFINVSANELHQKSKIFAGDVVAVRTGQAGTAAVVPRELDGANCIDLLIVRRSEKVLPQFVYYYLNSRAAISQATELSVGAIQAHYNTSTLAQLVVPKSPSDEQSRIVTHLDETTGEIDRLIARVRQAIDHLREFRTALISAAVTGKIDVREAAPR